MCSRILKFLPVLWLRTKRFMTILYYDVLCYIILYYIILYNCCIYIVYQRIFFVSSTKVCNHSPFKVDWQDIWSISYSSALFLSIVPGFIVSHMCSWEKPAGKWTVINVYQANHDKLFFFRALWYHPLSTYAKYSEKLLFLTPWYAHKRVCIRVLEMLVIRKI